MVVTRASQVDDSGCDPPQRQVLGEGSEATDRERVHRAEDHDAVIVWHDVCFNTVTVLNTLSLTLHSIVSVFMSLLIFFISPPLSLRLTKKI